MKKMLVFLLAVCFLFSAVACTAQPTSNATEPATNSTETASTSTAGVAGTADGETIKIGVSCPISGAFAADGEMFDRAIKLINENLSEKGGLVRDDGTILQVQFIVEDDEGDAESCVNAFNKLIYQDNVSAIIGPNISGCLLAAGEISQAAGIPTIGTTTTNPACTEIGDYIFRACFIDSFQATVAAKYMMDQGWTSVGLLTNNADDYSNGLSSNFVTAYEGMGGSIVASETYSDTGNGEVKDFSVQLTKIKSANPQAVFAPVHYICVPDIMRQANQLGLNVPFLGTDGWDPLTSLNLLDSTTKANVQYVAAFTTEIPTETSQDFVQRFRDNFNIEPNGNSAYAYDATLAMCEAIRTAKSTDPADIRDALANLSNFEGATGALKFDENRNPIKDAYILGFEGEDLVYITTVNPGE